ncbi:hypothetical protein DD630_06165 [Streptomyces sp. BSE7F]|nr:hypothetical protein DD630_06165 [Streptomyces sp. BSE7F]
MGQGDVPGTVLAGPEGNAICVLEPRGIHRDTGPPAAVVIDCADPRAMAALWGEALDRTVHEVTDAYASLRSPRPQAPAWSSSAPRTATRSRTASASASASRLTIPPPRSPAAAPCAPPLSARAG